MADLGRDDLRAPGLSVTSSVESSAMHVAQYHWARVNGYGIRIAPTALCTAAQCSVHTGQRTVSIMSGSSAGAGAMQLRRQSRSLAARTHVQCHHASQASQASHCSCASSESGLDDGFAAQPGQMSAFALPLPALYRDRTIARRAGGRPVQRRSHDRALRGVRPRGPGATGWRWLARAREVQQRREECSAGTIRDSRVHFRATTHEPLSAREASDCVSVTV